LRYTFMDQESVIHTNVTSRSSCINKSKKKSLSIETEISNKGFTDEIVQLACRIYVTNSQSFGVKRKTKRGKMLFFCVTCAYRDIGKPYDPIDVGRKFELRENDILNVYSGSNYLHLEGSYQPKPIDHTLNLLLVFADKFLLSDDAKKELVDIYRDINLKMIEKEEHEMLSPRGLASALMGYYLAMNGIDSGELPTITHLTSNSIKTAKNRIAEYIE
jgi:hypothetical protein